MWQRDSGNNASSAPAKKRSAVGSALRFAYVPRFGHNIGEMGRVLGMFPRLVAGIFAMKGMFPRQHPALRDETLRLKITEVLRIAYASLEWNQAGVPRILFFFAVVASLVFSIVAAVFAILGFFSAPAHAMPSMFTSPSPTTDLGNTWLEHIFQGNNFRVDVPTTDVNNVPNGNVVTQIGGTLPGLFRNLAGMYSTAMLVLAVIILVYHLIGMTAMTAHEGTAMGRSANKVWAPVRLVFALGLLVPVANGFSSGQWLVSWIAKQGSGLASYVWGNPGTGIGETFINQGNKSVTTPVTLPLGMLKNLAVIGGCGVLNQIGDGSKLPGAGTPWYKTTAPASYLANPYNSLIIAPNGGGNPTIEPSYNAVNGKGFTVTIRGVGVNETQAEAEGMFNQHFYPYYREGGNTGAYQTWTDVEKCGSVVFPQLQTDPNLNIGNPRDFAMTQALARAHILAYRRVYYRALSAGAVHQAAKSSVNPTTLSSLTMPYGLPPSRIREVLERLANEYRQTYAATVNGAGVPGLSYNTTTNSVEYAPVPNPVLEARLSGNPNLGTVGDLGWMSAAGFFLKMATANSLLQRAANLGPNVTTGGGGVTQDLETNLSLTVGYEGETTSTTDGTTKNTLFNQGGELLSGLVMKILAAFGLANDRNQMIWQTQFTSPFPLSDILNLGNKLLNSAITCVWVGAAINILAAQGDANGMMLSVFGTGQTEAEKDKQVRNWQNRVNASLSGLKDLPGGIMDTLGKALGNSMIVAIAAIPSLLFMLAGIMFLPGIVLFYVLPTLPFLNFLTGILTWFISLLGAVVAIPVIAIAHLTPQGEGLPSSSARSAYTMILQIFLRPVMMIFGLLIFVMIMNTAIPILNTLFFGIYTKFAAGGESSIMSSLVFFVLYAAAAFGICNIAISAIDELPMKAVSWIGGSTADTNHDVNKLGAFIIAQAAQGMIQGGLNSINQATRNANSIQRAQQGYQEQQAQLGRDAVQREIADNLRNLNSGGNQDPGSGSNNPGGGGAGGGGAGDPGVPSRNSDPNIVGRIIQGGAAAGVLLGGKTLFDRATGHTDSFNPNAPIPSFAKGLFNSTLGASDPKSPMDMFRQATGGSSSFWRDPATVPDAGTGVPDQNGPTVPSTPVGPQAMGGGPDNRNFPHPPQGGADLAFITRHTTQGQEPPSASREQLDRLFNPASDTGSGYTRVGDEIASASVPRSSGGLQSPGTYASAMPQSKMETLVASAKVPGGGARHASPNVATRYQGGGGGANPYNTRTLVNNLSRYFGRGFGGQCLNRVFYQGMGGADPKANRLLDQSPHGGHVASDAIYWMKRDDRFVTVGKGYNGSSINTPGYKPQLGDVYVSTGEIGNSGVGHIQVYIGNGHWQSDGTAGGKFGVWHAADRGTEYIFRLKSDNNGAAGLADTGGGGSRDVSGMERDDYAVAFFQSRGWTREESIGIVASLVHENGLKTEGYDYKYGEHYGIAQWSPERQKHYEKLYGHTMQSVHGAQALQEQLGFIDWELRNTEKAAGDRLAHTTTIEEATRAFGGGYERFAKEGTAEFEKEIRERIATANEIASGAYHADKVPDGTTIDGEGGGGGSDGGGGNGPGYQEENFDFYKSAINGLAYITKKQYNVASGKIEETRG